MPEIMDLAHRHGFAVIEDAAHAPGAKLKGKSLGTWGDVGCFSFFSNKNLSTGEGGMLVTNRDDVAEKVRLLRSHGMTSLTWDRHQGHAYTYDVVDLGYNYRIDEVRSALGLVQLDKLVAGNAQRAAITQRYWDAFSDTALTLPFLNLSDMDDAVQPAYHIFPVLLPPGADRRQFIDQMKIQAVQTSIHYPPIHQFRFYRDRYPGVKLPRTEDVASREVTLPLYPTMASEQVEVVVSAVMRSL
jgi:dTDP-4-amino-4,6-dideoxygalactose transaminase